MNRTFFGIQPGSSKINSDVSKFRTLAQTHQPNLVPWTQEELELVSHTEINRVTRKGFGRSAQALVESIYHEPMFYYYYKEYPATKKSSILLAQTHNYEFVYRIRAKETQVFINEEYFGSLQNDGTLLAEDKRTVLGGIDRTNHLRCPIYADNVMLGSVVLPEHDTAINARAFDVDEKMSEHQFIVFMTLGIYDIVMHLNGK